MRIPVRLLPAVALGVVLAACSAGGATPAPTDPSSSGKPPAAGGEAPGLEGRTFLSTSLEGRALVPGSRVRLSFAGGEIGASAGCNSMGGPYAVEAGRLVIGDLFTTEMACEVPLMEQDAWLAGFLGGAMITLGGDSLTLEKEGVILILLDREVADPDRPLTGTIWVVDGLVTGDAVSSVPAGVAATLVFAGDRVNVAAGCNRGSAPVGIADTTLTFGSLALTKMACPADVIAVERAVVATLTGSVAFAIEADTLTLDAGDAGLVLRAEP